MNIAGTPKNDHDVQAGMVYTVFESLPAEVGIIPRWLMGAIKSARTSCRSHSQKVLIGSHDCPIGLKI